MLEKKKSPADAEIEVSSVENSELKVLPLKPGVGQYIAIHATPIAKAFFLVISTLPLFQSIHLHFFQGLF